MLTDEQKLGAEPTASPRALARARYRWKRGDRVSINPTGARGDRVTGTVRCLNADGTVVVDFDGPVRQAMWCTAGARELTRAFADGTLPGFPAQSVVVAESDGGPR